MPLEQYIPQAAGAILGLALQGANDRRQIRQQEKLQNLQIAGSKQLTDYNTQKQLEMWRATSYPAQMAMMKQAGLNPALMYGMSGGGGQTANISQGQVSSGNAPTGGGEIMGLMGMAQQNQLIQAQTELAKAQANATNVHAAKEGGIDTQEAETRIQAIKQQILESAANITKIGQETKNLQAQEALTNVETSIKELQQSYDAATLHGRTNLLANTLEQAKTTLQILQNNKDISDATKETQIKQFKADLANTLMSTRLLAEQKKLPAAQIKLMQDQGNKIAKDIAQGNRRLDIEKMNAETLRNKQFDESNDVSDPVLDILDQLGIFIPIPGASKISPIRGFHNR